MRELRRLLIGLIAVLVPCTLAACGSSGSSGSSGGGATAQPSQATSLGSLYSSAKKEGSVVWEVGSPTPEFQPLVSGFEAKYPGITVSLINIQGPQVDGRIISEGKDVTFDVATLASDEVLSLLPQNLVAKPNWSAYGVPQNKVVLGGYLLHTYDFPIGWFYNTDKLSSSSVPHSFQTLLGPSWKGDKVTYSALNVFGIEANYVDGSWSASQYTAYLKEMKAQNWTPEVAGATELNAVARGQQLIGETALVQLPLYLKKGAPLAIAPIGPVTIRPAGPLVLAHAKHPAAATLLSAYLASAEAAPLWAQIGFGSAAPCSAGTLAQQLCAAKVKLVYINTVAEAQRYTAALKLNQSVFGNAG